MGTLFRLGRVGRVALVGSAAAVLVLAGWVVWSVASRARMLAITYRIGADHAPPYHYLRSDGTIGGLAVDVLNEAARRTGVRLEWIPVEGQLDDAFAAGEVELWPVARTTPGRLASLHATEPWLYSSFGVLYRKDAERGAGWAGKTLGYPDDPAVRILAEQAFRGAVLRGISSREQLVAGVCEGKLAGGLLDARFLDVMLLDRPRECNATALTFQVTRDAPSGLSILSTEQAVPVAEVLRESIADMAQNGSLAKHFDRWTSADSEDLRSLYALQDSERRNRLYVYVLCCSFSVGGILVWQIRRAQAARAQANQARSSAEQANAAKTDFLANMSHEIRTPLNGVLGMTRLILEGPLSEDKRDDLETVRDSAESLLDILNEILDYSKLETGNMRLEEAPFDLPETLLRTVNLFRLTARRRGVLMRLELEEGVPIWMLGDEGRVRQIILNLVGNAVKFTHTGEIVVRAEVLETGIRVLVRDSGIGIPDSLQPHLFSKFTQADSSTTRKYGGTGLGLAISKQLVDLMGGTIGVISAEGVGSTFRVDLPLRATERPKAQDRKTQVQAFVPGSGSGGRILVAEDNTVNQRLVTGALAKLGYEIDVAATGAEAVRKWEETDYEMVLMDCQMPEMDGYQATKAIRQKERGRKRTPIVALTAHVMPGDRERCRNAGMDDYLGKPLRLDELALMVHRYAGLDTAPQVRPEHSGAPNAESDREPESRASVRDLTAANAGTSCPRDTQRRL